MIVLKFGGTSVKDAARMRAVGELVRGCLDRRPLLVLSAMGGVTDALLALGRQPDLEGVEALAARHRETLSELGVEADDAGLEPLLSDLTDHVRGIALLGEISPRSRDLLSSYGERLSVRVFAAYLRLAGIPATAVDAWELGLVSDGRFGAARILPPDREEVARRLAAIEGVPVVTGFITRSGSGEITTFGRGGSDYSAAAIGEAIGAEEIQIWTDVDGVLSADPRVVPGARLIPELTFEEASEVAYYGAKVLHPATIQPAVEDEIPVRVLNTYRPESPGTLILARSSGEHADDGLAKAIVHKRDVSVVNITSTRMLAQHGFLARIFDAFARHEVVVDMVATSEVSVSVTCAQAELSALLAELRAFATVTVEGDAAMVALVGRNFRDAVGVGGQVFGALADAGIPVRMISQGATKINVTFVVADGDVEAAVQALHRELIE